MELLIVTGMSGAGKSQAANALEDMGFYCVDNVPPAIIPSFVDLSSKSGNELQRIAVVTDSRVKDMLSDISDILLDLKEAKVNYKILFLDAKDEILVRRYKENRRKHPLLSDDITLADAVALDRKVLNRIRQNSDYIVDTSYISIAQLKEKLSGIFFGSAKNVLKIQCRSFGFKYGTDTEADLVFDVRCLPNPFYIKELKHKTGLDKEINDYVLNNKESIDFKEKLLGFIDTAIPLYAKEGKSQLIIAFGCTGGKHRSVTFAQLVAKHLKEQDYDCVAVHRDIQKR